MDFLNAKPHWRMAVGEMFRFHQRESLSEQQRLEYAINSLEAEAAFQRFELGADELSESLEILAKALRESGSFEFAQATLEKKWLGKTEQVG